MAAYGLLTKQRSCSDLIEWLGLRERRRR